MAAGTNSRKESCCWRKRGHTAHSARVTARARNYLPQSSGGIFEVAGSEPAKDGVSGFGSARIENTAGGDQGILRPVAGWLARASDRKAERHPGGIQGKLRAAGAAGLDVPELFRAGEREAGVAVARERFAGLPG